MSAMSDYLENLVLNFVGNGTAITGITPYVALFEAAPSDSGGGTECDDSNYVRQACAAAFPNASGTAGSLTNSSAAIEFPAFASSQTITHVGIFDASTSGNLLMHGALSSPVTVGSGEVFRFNTSQLTLTMA